MVLNVYYYNGSKNMIALSEIIAKIVIDELIKKNAIQANDFLKSKLQSYILDEKDCKLIADEINNAPDFVRKNQKSLEGFIEGNEKIMNILDANKQINKKEITQITRDIKNFKIELRTLIIGLSLFLISMVILMAWNNNEINKIQESIDSQEQENWVIENAITKIKRQEFNTLGEGVHFNFQRLFEIIEQVGLKNVERISMLKFSQGDTQGIGSFVKLFDNNFRLFDILAQMNGSGRNTEEKIVSQQFAASSIKSFDNNFRFFNVFTSLNEINKIQDKVDLQEQENWVIENATNKLKRQQFNTLGKGIPLNFPKLYDSIERVGLKNVERIGMLQFAQGNTQNLCGAFIKQFDKNFRLFDVLAEMNGGGSAGQKIVSEKFGVSWEDLQKYQQKNIMINIISNEHNKKLLNIIVIALKKILKESTVTQSVMDAQKRANQVNSLLKGLGV